MDELESLEILSEGTSSHHEGLPVNDAGSVRCPNTIQTITKNKYTYIMYERKCTVIEIVQCDKHDNNKTDISIKNKNKKMEKDIKSKGCWSSTKRKAKRTKQAVKKKGKEQLDKHIRKLLLGRAIICLISHMADVGTDGNTAYSHYTNENIGQELRMSYAYWTVVCMLWSMLAAFIMCIMYIITHKEWSDKQKCLMVGLFIVLFPANSSLILLWDVVSIYRSKDPRNRGHTAGQAGIMKLIEALSETVPQTVLQLEIVSQLLQKNIPVPPAVWLGIGTSIPSLAFTVATNLVFDDNAPNVHRAVWLFGCVVVIPIRVAVMIMGGGLWAWQIMVLTHCAMVIMRHVHDRRLNGHMDEVAITNVHAGSAVSYKWFILALACLFVVVGFITYGRLAYHVLAIFLFVICLTVSLIYCTMVIIKHICGEKLKWTPWPPWQPLRDEKNEASRAVRETSCYGGHHLAAITVLCLFSVSLCMFDSCCSVTSLAMSCVTLVIALREYPFTYWHLPESMAMTIVALAIFNFILNVLMVVIPKFRSIGNDWDKAWDNTVDQFIKWLNHHRSDTINWFKRHVSSQPTRCNGNKDNDNSNENEDNSGDDDTSENYNNGYDNNGYDNTNDDVANVDDNNDSSDEDDTEDDVHNKYKDPNFDDYGDNLNYIHIDYIYKNHEKSRSIIRVDACYTAGVL